MASVMMKPTMKHVNTMEEIAVDQMLTLVTVLSVNVQIQIMEEVLQVILNKSFKIKHNKLTSTVNSTHNQKD